MEARDIYKDIAERTGGDVYIGVVGPVRCGKSTFIKNFMETAVVPNIKGEYDKKRTLDEMPQSAGGKTVMTTEPKFIPDEAVNVTFGDASMRVRMIDCVGYIVPDALGTTENGEVRMVHTPWSDTEIPFEQAAETGTSKVIREHSTVGMMVTCDGSFGDIPRDNFVDAEERTAAELKDIGKPFVVVLNSKEPESPAAEQLAEELENKYGAPVALVNCLELNSEDVNSILEMLLYEFPVAEIRLRLPGWTGALPQNHRLSESILSTACSNAGQVASLNALRDFCAHLGQALDETITEGFSAPGAGAFLESVNPGDGTANIEIRLPESVYYSIICDLTGICVTSEKELISAMLSLSEAKKELDKYSAAINQLEENGYGIVLPEADELTLEEPQIIRRSGSYGVRLKASAHSVHMIRADIETEINPIVGTEEQSEELIRNLMSEFEEDPGKIWDSKIFGKSLYELVNDGLHSKVDHLSEQSREKLSETLSRIVNEGSGGLICIIL